MTLLQPERKSHARTRDRGGQRWLVLLLGALSLGSCQAGPGGETGRSGTIGPEAFVEAIVALRTSELLDTSGFLPEGGPEKILEEQGLAPDDLRHFVEAYGKDVELMAALWNEIERRVNEIRNLRRS